MLTYFQLKRVKREDEDFASNKMAKTLKNKLKLQKQRKVI